MSSKNINNLIGDLVEITMKENVDNFEDKFRQALSGYINFCYSCGDFTVVQSLCSKCVVRSMASASDLYNRDSE